ncbi:MAG: ATP-binding protein [Desulfobacterales bacterium]|nr:ATP-binding protein [Desulfobacterales bacterium]
MTKTFTDKDYKAIRDILQYPKRLKQNLGWFSNTSEIVLPEDPVDRVVFQKRARKAIRKVAQAKGSMLMVGRPGTGKSMLAKMFREIVDRSMGDHLRPKEAIVAYPGKDETHVRFSYMEPEIADEQIDAMREALESARFSATPFSLAQEIETVKRWRNGALALAAATAILGFFIPTAFIFTGIFGMAAVFMLLQENNHRAQEKLQNEKGGRRNDVKHLADQLPEVLYDPRHERELMVSVAEPDARSMKGGFRHDPYQSGNLQTPIHKRTFLGAHATAPIIFMDEIKTLISAGYMSSLLEIMQNKRYILEGGKSTGSGAADRSENHLKAENIIIACCNYDTLGYLQKEGNGAFLSRIEERGEIIHMEGSVPEDEESIREVAQYIRQEVIATQKEYTETWGPILVEEGYEGVRKRSAHIFGRELPETYELRARDFTCEAVAEVVKELRCRASDGKLSALLRPINGIVRAAQHEAILENAPMVTEFHVRKATESQESLEGALSREVIAHKKDLKEYITSMTDAIGYVVGLAVVTAPAGGQMYGQPLPIHCQINAGGSDRVAAPGKLGEIAKAAAQNVRASIKKTLRKVGVPYAGYEMHIEYIQAHGGVEGDSASMAMDIGLISDFIKIPVDQQIAITGSLTGDIVLAVGGVTEKVRCIMDVDLNMKGACIPWQNRHDIEPLLVNRDTEVIAHGEIPGIRIFREDDRQAPFDVFFIKTKFNAYEIMMGLSRHQVEKKMAERSVADMNQAWRSRKGEDAQDQLPPVSCTA